MAAAEATAPVSTAFSSVTRGLVSIPQAIGDHFGTVSENRRLKKQIADNRELLMRARTLAYDNRRLKTLLAMREPTRRRQLSVAGKAVAVRFRHGGRWVMNKK